MENKNMPAMPIEFNGFGQYAPEAHTGLTKREQFAAMAMQGLLASDTNCEWKTEKMAAYAVKCADALLEELSK